MADDAWYVGDCCFEGDDLQTVVSFRGMPRAAARRRRPRLVILKWPYDAKKDGMPRSKELERMHAFEDELEGAVAATGLGYHAARLTGNGRRTWRYYVADARAFLAAARPVLAAHGDRAFVFRNRDDAEWSALAELQAIKNCPDTERFADR